jgi:hypothetical protein
MARIQLLHIIFLLLKSLLINQQTKVFSPLVGALSSTSQETQAN